jgi:hypothetical protein
MANKHNRKRNKKLHEFKVNDIVTVAIPQVDRGHSDMPRLPAKIIEIKERDNVPTRYKLATTYGVLDVMYVARDLKVYPGILQIEPAALGRSVSLTSVAALASDHTGTLTASCNCMTDCTSNRCACKKANQHCSSHCHSNQTAKKKSCCKNKINNYIFISLDFIRN